MISNVEKELDDFGQRVISKARQNLLSSGKKDTGGLYNSLEYDVKVSRNSFEFSFSMEDYGDFVDKGVKGVSSSQKALKSPLNLEQEQAKKAD